MSVNIIRSIVLVIILLVLSCEEFLPIEIEGCITNSACNYNIEATVDDGSCVASQGCNKWCEGDTTTVAAFDCADVCGGDAIIDACNNCGGDCVADENEFFSCSAGNVNNLIKADVCGVCGGSGIPTGKCDCEGNVLGCDGVCGSGLVDDNCDVCGGNNAPLTGICDCSGTPGQAYTDGCGDCVGGNTGITECQYDCLGVLNGDAVYDKCGEGCIAADPSADCSAYCDDDSSNNCAQDCNGGWGGDLVEDECGVCDGLGYDDDGCCSNPVSSNYNGSVDCVGVCGGSAVEDECGVCNGTGLIDNFDCNGNCIATDDNLGIDNGGTAPGRDCNGECGGSAEVNACGECGGDVVDAAECTGIGCMDITACNYNNFAIESCDNCCEYTIDCAGVCGGLHETDVLGRCCVPDDQDECGICNGIGSSQSTQCCYIGEFAGLNPNSEGPDCSGICGGTAVIDGCGICEGNNDCFGCNDWYMDNFICDKTTTDGKCCQEDPTNSDYRCLILQNAYCDESAYCQLEFEMECDEDDEYCDYDGAYIGAPCSTTEDTFTEGVGECKKQCDAWSGLCFNITCESIDGYCDYNGAVVGVPCSTTEDIFTEGSVGECILNITDDPYTSTGYITFYNAGCEDGTDGCCEEPICDEPFTLSLEYIDENTLRVNYSSTEAIGGFQFDIYGATTTGGSGGDAAANNLGIFSMESTVLSFDQGGGSIPAGSGILTNLDVTITSTENLCLKNTLISDPVGTAINSCPEYWQVTCIEQIVLP